MEKWRKNYLTFINIRSCSTMTHCCSQGEPFFFISVLLNFICLPNMNYGIVPRCSKCIFMCKLIFATNKTTDNKIQSIIPNGVKFCKSIFSFSAHKTYASSSARIKQPRIHISYACTKNTFNMFTCNKKLSVVGRNGDSYSYLHTWRSLAKF